MDERKRTSGVADAVDKPQPELALSHLDGLPTLEPVAVKLLQATADSKSDVEEIAQLLRGDPALTAKLLSVANAAATGARGPVRTVEKAVALLGFAAVRSLVLAVKVFEAFAAKPPPAGQRAFERNEFWKHALAVACAARRLAAARREFSVDTEEAFVAGLLHDLGKIALSAVFPKAYDRIAAQADHARGDIADAERTILGIDHTIAGRRLAERWNLPRPLQETIWLHHLSAEALPSNVLTPQLIALVQLADTLAREQRIGYSGNHSFYEPSRPLAQRLGFSEADVEAVAAHLVGDVAEQVKLLGLDAETSEAMYLKALTRANGELGRINAELTLTNQKLAAGARHFKALSEFDRQLTPWSDLPAVVAAIAGAARIALQRPRVAAFGLHEPPAVLELCWTGETAGAGGAATQGVTEELKEWLKDPSQGWEAMLLRVPRALRAALAPAAAHLGRGEPWLLPILHDNQCAGGIVFCSETDERARLGGEIEELRSFLASLGLALGQANAQAAVRRLSDDLAETNRRLQQMQAELLRSRTLSMIAEMAAGAGHELNSPLTVISGRAQMLQQAVEDPEIERSLQMIHVKAHECSRIVTELMDFARPRPPRMAAVDLAELLNEARTEWLARAALPPARLLPEYNGALPRIWADREQIKTVLRELLGNATDATLANQGGITLGCRAAPGDPAAEIIVRDAGCGMTPQVLERAFDPFFSHRAAGRGRGLGLPRAHRIVEAHGGRIWLESRPGEGTTAHVILPAAGEAARE